MTEHADSGSDSQQPSHDPAELPQRQFGWWDMFVRPEEDPREAGVEQHWFRSVMAGQDVPRLYRSADSPNADHGTISLRAVMVHMIEEYARHLGHADFLRERIDGRVGQ